MRARVERSDALVVAVSSGSLMLVSAAAAAVQTAWVLAAVGHPGAVPTAARLAANAVEAIATAAALVGLGVHRQERLGPQATRVLLAGVIASGARFATQWAVGIHRADSWETRAFQLGAGLPMALIAGGFALVALAAVRRIRAAAERAARDAEARRAAMQALEDEEVRVRREVAEGLHGTAQQRLVLVVAGLDHLLATLGPDVGPATVALVRDLREKVETVRGGDVRQASRLLYPHQVEVGLVAAVRSLVAEVPACVATRLTVDPAVTAVDEPGASRFSRGERLLVVRVVEEALNNALRHGRATTVAVAVRLDGDTLVATVTDDGCGFAPGGDGRWHAGGGGLARLSERVRLVGGELSVGPDPGGGVAVSVRVPAEALRPAAAGSA